MKLTDKEKKILLEKLTFLKKTKCLCGAKEWIANDTVFEMREFQAGNLIIGGQSSILAVISVQCRKCGNVILFNALTMGVISNKNESKK